MSMRDLQGNDFADGDFLQIFDDEMVAFGGQETTGRHIL